MSASDAVGGDDEKCYETLEEITKAIKKAGVNNLGLIFGEATIKSSLSPCDLIICLHRCFKLHL